MDFKTAKTFTMPFGKKYRDMAIDKIAETDEGLLWLDWARGVATSARVQEALDAYLDDPAIKEELGRAIRGGR